MADIAFLILTFFMISTQMNDEKGLSLVLPRFVDAPLAPVNKRNIFSIQVNSANQFMINHEIRPDLTGLRSEIKSFILNYGKNPNLSDHPQLAIVSFMADRGTTHGTYVHTLDEIQAAYHEIYAERAEMTAEQFRKLDLNIPNDRLILEKAKNGIPMNISIVDSNR